MVQKPDTYIVSCSQSLTFNYNKSRKLLIKSCSRKKSTLFYSFGLVSLETYVCFNAFSLQMIPCQMYHSIMLNAHNHSSACQAHTLRVHFGWLHRPSVFNNTRFTLHDLLFAWLVNFGLEFCIYVE